MTAGLAATTVGAVELVVLVPDIDVGRDIVADLVARTKGSWAREASWSLCLVSMAWTPYPTRLAT
jgi:hypothetical protein